MKLHKFPNINEVGQIYIWSYKDNPHDYKGLHLSCDTKCCDYFIEACEKLVQKDSLYELVIPLSSDNKNIEKVTGCTRKYKYYEKLFISHNNEDVEFIEFNVIENNVFIRLSTSELMNFKKGIQDIKKQEGDYSIGSFNKDEFNQIWFWWYMG